MAEDSILLAVVLAMEKANIREAKAVTRLALRNNSRLADVGQSSQLNPSEDQNIDLPMSGI